MTPAFTRPDVGATGTLAPAPETLQSALLREHGDALAREATRRLYAACPELTGRYGERGFRHTYDDQFWHLATLDSAWAVGAPALVDDYVRWLTAFLAGHGMGEALACANFGYLDAGLAALPAGEERDALRALLARAMAAFSDETRRVAAGSQVPLN